MSTNLCGDRPDLRVSVFEQPRERVELLLKVGIVRGSACSQQKQKAQDAGDIYPTGNEFNEIYTAQNALSLSASTRRTVSSVEQATLSRAPALRDGDVPVYTTGSREPGPSKAGHLSLGTVFEIRTTVKTCTLSSSQLGLVTTGGFDRLTHLRQGLAEGRHPQAPGRPE